MMVRRVRSCSVGRARKYFTRDEESSSNNAKGMPNAKMKSEGEWRKVQRFSRLLL